MGLQPGSIGDFLYLYCHANSLMGLQSGTPVYNGFCTNKLYPSRHEFYTGLTLLHCVHQSTCYYLNIISTCVLLYHAKLLVGVINNTKLSRKKRVSPIYFGYLIPILAFSKGTIKEVKIAWNRSLTPNWPITFQYFWKWRHLWTWCICSPSSWKSQHVVFNSLIEEGDEDKDED